MKIREIFDEMDIDGDGYCDKYEVRAAMERSGKIFSDRQFEIYFNRIDKNGDGRLSLEEVLRNYDNIQNDDQSEDEMPFEQY